MTRNVQLGKDALSESASDIETYFNGINHLYPHHEYGEFHTEALGKWRKWEFSGGFNLLREQEVYNEARSALVRFTVEASGCIERMSDVLVMNNMNSSSDILEDGDDFQNLPQWRRIELLSEIDIIPSDHSLPVNNQVFTSVNSARGEIVHDSPSALNLSDFSSMSKYLFDTTKLMDFLSERVYGYGYHEIAEYLEKCMRNPYRDEPIGNWTLAQLVSRYQQHCGYLKDPENAVFPIENIEEHHEEVRNNINKVREIEDKIEELGYNLDNAIEYDELGRLGKDRAKFLSLNARNLNSSADIPDDMVTGREYNFSISVDFSDINCIREQDLDGVHWRGLLGISKPSLNPTPQDYIVHDIYPQKGDGTIGEEYTRLTAGSGTAEFSHLFQYQANYLVQMVMRVETPNRIVFVTHKEFKEVSAQPD